MSHRVHLNKKIWANKISAKIHLYADDIIIFTHALSVGNAIQELYLKTKFVVFTKIHPQIWHLMVNQIILALPFFQIKILVEATFLPMMVTGIHCLIYGCFCLSFTEPYTSMFYYKCNHHCIHPWTLCDLMGWPSLFTKKQHWYIFLWF